MKLKPLVKDKKGISDIIFVIVSLFSVAIVLIISGLVGTQLKNTLVPFATSHGYNESAVAMNSTINSATASADWIFLVAIVLAFLGLIITSFLFYSHPAFMVVWIILASAAIVLSVIMANAYGDITSSPQVTVVMSQFPITDYIFHHFALFTLIAIAISIIVIYIKSQYGGGGAMPV